jgi:hypothetical protein
MSLADHLQRARDAVDAGAYHLDEAHDAAEAGDAPGVRAAHANIRRCIRTAQSCFRSIAAEAMQADSDANKQVQTSTGIGTSGGSANGRWASPLLKGDVRGWLDRARIGARHR